jgi:signal transduction histidine kinase
VTPRPHLPDVRPLDPLRSIKIKLGVLVATTVTAASLLVWAGLHYQLGPRYTVPGAVLVALALTQLLARGMTSPLREMTAAARAMATGDYSRRVRATSRDEVGELAAAFNRMAEDLQAVDRQRRELVANVSHELRTPVAALHAQLENLVDGVVPADEDNLGIALAQTERLSRLVSQLLDLSRLEAGAVPLQRESLALRPFLEGAVTAARLVAERDGRDVHCTVDVEPADLRVAADAVRLHQVVANLLDNAVRHSPAGGEVRVTVRRRGTADTASVVVEVADEGPGIAPEHRDRVFERFHRGGAAPGADGGTGLGLAIARWAVGLHGGSIEVADAASGCRIRVVLPDVGPTSRVPTPARSGA